MIFFDVKNVSFVSSINETKTIGHHVQ